VELLDVTEEILEKLLDVALTDAAADDVTPTLGATPGWNAERIGWFLNYHRAAAAGLDGPAAQKSWAISCDGRLAGSIRLKRAGTAASAVTALETGLWLGRSFRGRGIGREALELSCAPWLQLQAPRCCRPKRPPEIRRRGPSCARPVPSWPGTA
jgi:RimJ/RimL family protein N-acetyltransferase